MVRAVIIQFSLSLFVSFFILSFFNYDFVCVRKSECTHACAVQ